MFGDRDRGDTSALRQIDESHSVTFPGFVAFRLARIDRKESHAITPAQGLTNRSDPNRGATRVRIPADGTANEAQVGFTF